MMCLEVDRKTMKALTEARNQLREPIEHQPTGNDADCKDHLSVKCCYKLISTLVIELQKFKSKLCDAMKEYNLLVAEEAEASPVKIPSSVLSQLNSTSAAGRGRKL